MAGAYSIIVQTAYDLYSYCIIMRHILRILLLHFFGLLISNLFSEFVVIYISLEVACTRWCTCKIKTTSEKMMKPYLFKQVKYVLAAVHGARF
jgi:hypothetical protein